VWLPAPETPPLKSFRQLSGRGLCVNFDNLSKFQHLAGAPAAQHVQQADTRVV
jgi:hypothetical protein